MKRVSVAPRENYHDKALQSGVFAVEKKLNSGDIHRTWDETSAYLIDRDEVDQIMDSIEPIISMSHNAVDFLLDGEWGTLGIPHPFFDYIRNTFDDNAPPFITRYDFAYLGNGQVKLVGIDGDSPKGIMEVAQAQRDWLWEKFRNRAIKNEITQLNNLQEVAGIALKQALKSSEYKDLHIARLSDARGEDWLTSRFIKGIARKSGWTVHETRMNGIQWSKNDNSWIDDDGREINNLYKHFPWDMLINQKVSKDFINHTDKLGLILDPAWKMVLSSRAMLPALWEMYPNSKILSPASISDTAKLGNNIVTAPLLPVTSRNEMAVLKNRQFTSWGEPMKTFSEKNDLAHRTLEIPKRYKDKTGEYRFAYMSVFAISTAIVGIGMRETRLPLLGANSTFRPHLVKLT